MRSICSCADNPCDCGFVPGELVSNAPRKKKRRASPTQVDPTQTALLRRKFESDMRKRMRDLKALIYEFIVIDDTFALDERHSLAQLARREYEFLTDDKKLSRFGEWLQAQMDAKLLSLEDGDTPWNAKYIRASYKKGFDRAFRQVRKKDSASDDVRFYEGTRSEFFRSAFDQPEMLSKVRLLATRTFENMRGMTATMKSRLNIILADGMANRRGVVAIAKEINREIDKITATRALVIARTEMIHAHAEGQLDSMQALGLDKVSAMVEWSTAGDGRVCPQCEAMNGKVYSIKKARGLIPLHPNCRCAWIPAEDEIAIKERSKK